MIPLSPAPRYALPLMCVLVNASFALCPRPAARRVTATGPAPACPPLSLVARAAPRNTPRQAPPQALCPHPRVGGSAQARITPVTPGSRARPRPALLARPQLNPSVRPRLAQLVHHHARLAAARPARLIRTRPARGGDSWFLPLSCATRSATRPTVWTSVDPTALAPSRRALVAVLPLSCSRLSSRQADAPLSLPALLAPGSSPAAPMSSHSACSPLRVLTSSRARAPAIAMMLISPVETSPDLCRPRALASCPPHTPRLGRLGSLCPAPDLHLPRAHILQRLLHASPPSHMCLLQRTCPLTRPARPLLLLHGSRAVATGSLGSPRVIASGMSRAPAGILPTAPI